MGLLILLTGRKLEKLPIVDIGHEAECEPWCKVFTLAIEVENYFQNTKFTWRRIFQRCALEAKDPKTRNFTYIIYKIGKSRWLVENTEERLLLEFDEDTERKMLDEMHREVIERMKQEGDWPSEKEDMQRLERTRREIEERIIREFKLRREELIKRKKTNTNN